MPNREALSQTVPTCLLTWLSAAALTLIVSVAPTAGEARPFSVEDLVAMQRVGDPQVSPDGARVVFEVSSLDLDENRRRKDLWLAEVDGSQPPRRLTTHPDSDFSARWAPDGESFYFLSTRSGSSQVWRLRLNGGEAEPVTGLPLDVGALVVSPTGSHLAVALEVFIDCEDLACTTERLKAKADSKTTGMLFDQLFVRHWDTWKDGRRSHVFVVPTSGEGEPIDVTAALDADIPSKPFGGDEELTFSPDGRELVFTARAAGGSEPWSTDFDLYAAPIDGSAAPRKLTTNPAWDTQPLFSPDGKTLAYLAMARAGFEADRFRIVLRGWPTGEARVLTEAWDRSPGGITFSADGKTLYATAQDRGQVPLFAIDIESGAVSPLPGVGEGRVRSPSVAGDRLVYGFEHLRSPVELFAVPAAGGEPRRLTDFNRERLDAVRLGEPEQFSFAGWNGEKVWGWVVKPANFTAGQNYPVAFLIHGGPQGSFNNTFHYRWNPQTYAAAGYGVVTVDFHGSTGYGQAFTDAIRDDWGGKPLEDLQKGLAAALELYPWLDGSRACALGASYGGYMINWIAGNWADRFDCLVNHDGLFDMSSMYYSTEELWFPEWEMKGTPWSNPEAFARHNPADHVDKWKTPMLVIHGARDYRVPDTQGLATFTALQRRGVPSQLLFFPDENHWVLQPKNSIQWHETVLAWLERWTGEVPPSP